MPTIVEIFNDLTEQRKQEIENWLAKKFAQYPAILNVSVDLRDAGYKIAPVDTNIFPAGYNNFDEQSQKLASVLLQQYLSENYAKCKKIIIIPENHTRNIKYVGSLIVLKNMLEQLDFVVKIGNYNIDHDIQATYYMGHNLPIFSLIKKDGLIATKDGFIPDLIILNNDMTKGIPEILQNLTKQFIIPSIYLGWFNRRKSKHFAIYQSVSLEFCKEFGIDHWLTSALMSNCDDVSFAEKKGAQCIADKVDALIGMIEEKFKLYGIKERPYVFVKANNGTYGMGIMIAYHGEDVLQVNKKTRNKMNKIKDSQTINSVIIQEGIPSVDIFQTAVAEPLVYLIGHNPAAFLYRYNDVKDKFSNLNSLGCSFTDVSYKVDTRKTSVWSLIGRLAALSAAIEMHQITTSTP